jgi:hypothetical protein
MIETSSKSEWKRVLWIAPLAAIAYMTAQALAAMALESVPFSPPQISPIGSTGQQVAWGLVSALIISTGIAPLARHVQGRFVARWFVLAAFLYLLNTANTAIELTVFSRFGGQAYTAALGVLPALICAGVLTAIRPVDGTPLELAVGQSGAGLAARLAVCWLAFPVVYFVFGALISPFVIEAYSQEGGMIVIPPVSTIIAVQAIRSTLFLLPTFAVIERWTGTRLGLWLALGWAHWALVGLWGLVVPVEFMSPQLRLIHAMEIGVDSFAYTGILITLLVGRTSDHESESGTTGEPRIA